MNNIGSNLMHILLLYQNIDSWLKTKFGKAHINNNSIDIGYTYYIICYRYRQEQEDKVIHSNSLLSRCYEMILVNIES